jgi:ABC-2 type transport system ATP-binding protein
MIAIEVTNLSKVFNNFLFTKEKVLSNLNIQITSNSIFGLIGPNGAGKSTLLKIILDLIKPTSGNIKIFNQDHTIFNIRNKVGYVPERIILPPNFTPMKILNTFIKLYEKNSVLKLFNSSELLKTIKLTEESHKKINKLSKGMIQKLGIALSLLNDPDLILMDEPMSGLDSEGRIEFKKMLNRFKQEGKTILICSHNLNDIDVLCDKVAILNKGEILYSGELDELFNIENKYEIVLDREFVHDLEFVSSFESNLEKISNNILKIELARDFTLKEYVTFFRNKKYSVIQINEVKQPIEEAYLKIVKKIVTEDKP